MDPKHFTVPQQDIYYKREKSRNMIPFHKSQTPVQETFENTSITSSLKIINGNILYLTHEIDQIKTIVQQIHNTVNLKQQTLEHYESKEEIQ